MGSNADHVKVGDQVWVEARPSPQLAEVRGFDARRPHLVKVVYIASRTAAWIKRSRVLDLPAPASLPRSS